MLVITKLASLARCPDEYHRLNELIKWRFASKFGKTFHFNLATIHSRLYVQKSRAGCAMAACSSESFSGNCSIKGTVRVHSLCTTGDAWWHQQKMIRIHTEMFPIPPIGKTPRPGLIFEFRLLLFQGQLNYTNNELMNEESATFLSLKMIHAVFLTGASTSHSTWLIRKSALDVSKSSWLSEQENALRRDIAGKDIS